MADVEQLSFAEHALILLDRAERAIETLREMLRGADEFLLMARQRGTDELPTIIVDNQHVQSFGATVVYGPDHILVRINSRGEAAEKSIASGQHEVWTAVPEESAEEAEAE